VQGWEDGLSLNSSGSLSIPLSPRLDLLELSDACRVANPNQQSLSQGPDRGFSGAPWRFGSMRPSRRQESVLCFAFCVFAAAPPREYLQLCLKAGSRHCPFLVCQWYDGMNLKVMHL
jgi:hypothetical protein